MHTTIGIDVSKDRLDCATTDSRSSQFKNTVEGITELLDWIQALDQEIERIVLEATGSLSQLVQRSVGSVRFTCRRG